MADSSVDVTPGTDNPAAIDTRTESTNGNHRQVMVIGDASDNDGVAPVDSTDGLLVNLGSNNDVTITATPAVSSATETSFSVTTGSTEAIAANASRVGGYIQNISDENVNVSFGGTASTTTTLIFANGGSLPFDSCGVVYTGAINAICASGSKNLVIVEY